MCYLCSALGMVACPELSFQLLQYTGAQKCKHLWPPEPGDQGMFPCGLHLSTSISKAARECCEWGMSTALERQGKSARDRSHPVLVMQKKSA